MVESLKGSVDDVAYSKQVTLTVTIAEVDIETLKTELAMAGKVITATN